MTNAAHQNLIAEAGPERVVDALRPYITEVRREKIERVLGQRMAGVSVAVEAPSNPHNAAAIVRTAEALGVLDVHVIAAEGNALKAKSTTQGAYHWVHTHHHPRLDAFVRAAERTGTTLCGGWMDAPLRVEDLPADQRLCLLFGNEERGLSEAARAVCSLGFRVPMFGMSESLNLSVTAAISLYDVLRRRRVALGPSDLDAEAQLGLRAEAYLASVDARLAKGLLGERAAGEAPA